DPIDEDPVEYDREYPVVLSDWTFENPYEVLKNLQKMDGYYDFQRRDVGEFIGDVKEKGLGSTVKDYLSFARMRMSATDISDVTGATYRSEEHTSELQSRFDLVCRLLLEK